jgi:hypothetical protein
MRFWAVSLEIRLVVAELSSQHHQYSSALISKIETRSAHNTPDINEHQ